MKRCLTVAILFLICSSASAQDARALWKDVLKKCTADDVLGPKLLYLGPSNDVGAGTIWRKTGLFKGYGLRWLAASVQNPPTFLQPGVFATCKGTSASTMKVGAGVALTTSVYPVGGEISADLGRGVTTNVSVGSWRWEQIVEGPYEEAVKKTSSEGVKSDLQLTNRFIMTRALHVKGLTSDIAFDKNAAVGLKAKYDGKKIVVGGLTLNATFKDETTLHLTSDQEFYIAGELRPWRTGSVAGSASKIGDVVDAGTAQVKNDLPKH